jgi:exodeoxyribonuclease-5
MAKMQLSEEQGQAVTAVVNWFKGKKQVFELSGPAGTGKTTLAKYITEELELTGSEVMYCAFTGKAALVLSQKGCSPSSTVHGLIYRAHQNEQTGEWSFSLTPEYIRELGVKLIVLDEAPMLGADIAEDLIYCGVKVLALGDKHQLPPVNGEAYFGVREPDFLLTEVHRQAADSPIIALATLVRSGGTLKIGNYGESRVISAKKFDPQMMLEVDQVLCGKNDTRHYLNGAYRKVSSYEGWEPTEGERLICLRNNRDRGFLNGQMFLVEETVSDGKDVSCMVKPVDYPETLAVKISTPIEYFQGSEASLDWRVRKNCDEFAFAYAISVHKSQGSQWQNLMVLDQSRVFKQDAHRHLYTAITRASDKVTVLI